MAAVMREQSRRCGKSTHGRANLAVKRISATASLLLQFANILHGKFAFASRLRNEFRLDFGSLARNIHHVLFCHVTYSTSSSTRLCSDLKEQTKFKLIIQFKKLKFNLTDLFQKLFFVFIEKHALFYSFLDNLSIFVHANKCILLSIFSGCCR